MRVRNERRSGFLFVSGSVYRRTRLFRDEESCEIFLRCLEAYCHKFAFTLHAYVLMPEHYHMLIWVPPNGRFTDFLRDFKSMAAHELVAMIKARKWAQLLTQLEIARKRSRPRDAKYCVLQPGNHVKEIAGSKILAQKIAYIHANPVRAEMAERIEDYRWSSAGAYLRKGSLIRVDPLW